MSRVLTLALVLGLGLLVSCGEDSPTTPPQPQDPMTTGSDNALVPQSFMSILDVPGLIEGHTMIADMDIPCDGLTTVTVRLIGQNSIEENPADVMLVLDRSGSMSGTPLANLKTAANFFVDIIDEATDGVLDGVIDGSRVGVVSFATTATLNQALTSNAAAVKSAINSLVAGGNTAAGDGMNLAQAQLAGSNPGSLKIMIVVSDGESNTGSNPSAAAAAARAAGTEIFAIGFGSINEASIRDWASDPDSEHAFFSPDSSTLEETFEDIGADIVRPGGSDIMLQATVFDHFDILAVAVTKGAIAGVGNVLTWTIDELYSETVDMIITIAHDATLPGGLETVITSITYTDTEGNTPTFPPVLVNVRGCPKDIDLEPDTAINELGTLGQFHTVVGTVTDDFGDPVDMIHVNFEILSGPNAGMNDFDTTDVNGEATFMYVATQGLAGLGQDMIEGCFLNNAGVEVCDMVTKDWVDTTPPDVVCEEGPNPAGEIPASYNPDGFYKLLAYDAVDPDPQIFVDAGDGYIFGPFPSGTNVKYTEAPGTTPRIGAGPGVVDYKIVGVQDMVIYAVDASGNQSEGVTCFVPPPPSFPGGTKSSLGN